MNKDNNNKYAKSNHEKLLNHLVQNKSGTIESLEKITSTEEIKDCALMNYIQIRNNKYTITKQGIETYNTLYKEPNFKEQCLGLFCHYVLRY
jgi:hypothetical protein